MPAKSDLRARELIARISSAEQLFDWDLVDHLYKQLSILIPDDHRILANRARACWFADRPVIACKLYRAAQEIALQGEGPDPILLQGLGNALRDLNRFEEADRAYADCRELLSAPDIASWNHSQLLVGLERYEEAFNLSETRLQLEECTVYRDPVESYWDGVTKPEKLYVWTEQGFGDTLQYLRWIKPLINKQSVQLEVEEPLLSLVKDFIEPCLEVSVKSKEAPPLPASCEHISLLSLPSRLGLAPLENASGPYLGIDGLPSRSPGPVPRVGLVWSAGRSQNDPFTLREYKKRSLTTHVLAALLHGLHQQGAELVPLQVGPDHSAVRPWSHLFASDGITQ